MRGYILKRFIRMLSTFIGVIIFMFFIYLSLPGNFIDANMFMSPEKKLVLAHRLHIDESKVVQFKYWISGVLRGDLGESFVEGRPVSAVINRYFWKTFLMFFLSLLCALKISISISIKTALKPHSFADKSWTTFALFGISIPPFVIGAIFLKIFTFNQIVFQFSIWKTVSFESYSNIMRQYILPFLLITGANVSIFFMYLRSSMYEIINQEYIKTARAKGLSEKKVLNKHVLKNAMLPVITVFGTSLPAMAAYILIIETIMEFPGFGSLMIGAVHYRDYPLMMGCTMILAITILITNFLLDITYTFLDPRIRIS